MADIDLKAATPDTSLPSTGFLFGADSQSASAPSVYSVQTVATALLGSTSLTGATVTTSSPVLDLAQTWNAGAVTFTGLKFNATDTASASGSLLMDLQVGTVSKFQVLKSGNTGVGGAAASGRALLVTGYGTATTGFLAGTSSAQNAAVLATGEITVNNRYSFASGDAVGGTIDLFLTRRAAASLRLGAADAAAPVAQTLGVQSVTGVADTAGANFTIAGSQGTGTGAGGSIVFQVAPAGTAGSAQNALATALTISSVTGGGSLTLTGNATSSTITPFGSGVNAIHINNKIALGGTLSPDYSTYVASDCAFGWSSATTVSSGISDVRLYRDAANTLALRNGANAQAFRVYNTTDGTNLERAELMWFSNVARWQSVAAGTGTVRNMEIVRGSTTHWLFNSGGNNFGTHLLAATDNTYDIGATGAANRPRNLYVGTAIEAPYYSFNSRGGLVSNADGVFQLRNATNSNFDRLQFGGTTSSFPAIKRSSTTLQARLADDSAFAPVQGKLTTETAYTAGAPTATGYLVLYDSNGTAYKVAAEAL